MADIKDIKFITLENLALFKTKITDAYTAADTTINNKLEAVTGIIASTYNAETGYAHGAYCIYNNTLYRSIYDGTNTNHTPGAQGSEDYWEVATIASQLIRDTAVTENSSNLITSGAVYNAVSAIGQAMQIVGTLGTTGATITYLPIPAGTIKNNAYIVVEDGTYNIGSPAQGTIALKAGEMVVCAATGTNVYEWVKFSGGNASDVIIAAEYQSTGVSYIVGDYCMYQGLLYKATTTPSGVPGTIGSGWEAVAVCDELKALKTAVDSKQNAITDGSATIATKSGDVVTIKAGVAQTDGAITNSTGTDITLVAVATTGSYDDLSNTPTLGTAAAKDATDTITDGSTDLIEGGAVYTALAGKQNTITDGSATIATESEGVVTIKAGVAQSGGAISNSSGSDIVLGTAAKKAYTTSVDENSTDLVTSGAVFAAIDAMPEPMVFKGTVGTDGTVEWASLPAAAAGNNGYTYKVITDHATAPICAAGDTIISNGSEWVVIPSGDEPTGTVTSVAMTVPTGLEVSGTPITSSGTLAVSYASGYSIPTDAKQGIWDATTTDLAANYNASADYAVGDYVTKDGIMYKCKTAITGGEAWTAAHWDAVTVGGELKNNLPNTASSADINNLFA